MLENSRIFARICLQLDQPQVERRSLQPMQGLFVEDILRVDNLFVGTVREECSRRIARVRNIPQRKCEKNAKFGQRGREKVM